MTTPNVDYISEDEAAELIKGLIAGHSPEGVSEEICKWLLDIDYKARVTLALHKLIIKGHLAVRYDREEEEFTYFKREP